MDFTKYDCDIEFPSKQYKIYVYKNGQTKHIFWNEKSFQEWKSKEYAGKSRVAAQIDCIHERVWVNEAEYYIQLGRYNDRKQELHDQFKRDLFIEFGVENNPKAELCYQLCGIADYEDCYEEFYKEFKRLVILIREFDE